MKIIKFYQEGCSPCRSVSQYLDGENIDYDSVNVNDDPELAAKYGVVFSVPVTVLLNDDGEVLIRSEGYKTKELQEIIDNFNN